MLSFLPYFIIIILDVRLYSKERDKKKGCGFGSVGHWVRGEDLGGAGEREAMITMYSMKKNLFPMKRTQFWYKDNFRAVINDENNFQQKEKENKRKRKRERRE